MTPFFNNFEFWLSHFLEVLSQTSAGNNLSDKMDLLRLLTNPRADKGYDVWMMQLFDKFYFWLYSWLLRFRKSTQRNYAPGYFATSFVINTSINRFVSTTAEFFVKPLKSSWRRCFNKILVLLVLVWFINVIAVIIVHCIIVSRVVGCRFCLVYFELTKIGCLVSWTRLHHLWASLWRFCYLLLNLCWLHDVLMVVTGVTYIMLFRMFEIFVDWWCIILFL